MQATAPRGEVLRKVPSPCRAQITPCGSAPALDLGAVDGSVGNSVGAIGWPPGPCVASLQGPGGRGPRAPRQ